MACFTKRSISLTGYKPECQNDEMIDRCLEKGIITFYFLSCPESFRLAPPLTISLEELEFAGRQIVEAIEESSKELASSERP